MADIDRRELESIQAWEPSDEVPGRPEMTAFRRRLRAQQSRWRASHGHPIGTQPIAPAKGERGRGVGSRIPLAYAKETAANFLTPAAIEAARARMSVVEPNQSIDHQRVWADLLWSPSMGFNLFGDLAADRARAGRALRTWWLDTPGSVSDVRFLHSPGWLDPAYLNSLRAFDCLFELDLDDGTRALVAIDVNYHDWLKPETPKPSNAATYRRVATRSGAFRRGAIDALAARSGLALMWLEHLLLLSMLQHRSGRWSWGRYVVVHPEGNVDVAQGTERYRGMLTDSSTFASITLEELLRGRALPAPARAALRERYLLPPG